MKRAWILHLVALLCSCAVAGLILFVSKRHTQNTTKRPLQTFQISPDTLTSITYQDHLYEITLSPKKDALGFFLQASFLYKKEPDKPTIWTVQAQQTQKILQALQPLRLAQMNTASKNIPWKSYGLHKPGRLEIKTTDRTYTLEVGSESYAERLVYARLVEKPDTLLLIDPRLVRPFRQARGKLPERRLFSSRDIASYTHLTLQHDGKTHTLRQKRREIPGHRQWSFDGKDGVSIVAKRWARRLTSLRAVRYLFNTDANAKKEGQPYLRLTLFLQGDGKEELIVWKGEGARWFATSSLVRRVVEVSDPEKVLSDVGSVLEAFVKEPVLPMPALPEKQPDHTHEHPMVRHRH